MKKIATIILAAGSAHRMGGWRKPYLSLNLGFGASKMILRHQLDFFADYGTLQAVINEKDQDLYQKAVADFEGALNPPIIGGKSRAESVFKGLQALANDSAKGDSAEGNSPDIVLIHDSARPFITHNMVQSLILAIDKEGYHGAAPYLAVSDSLRKKNQGLWSPQKRDDLVRVQTPQAFDYQTLSKAFALADFQEEDDITILSHISDRVKWVEGDHRNIKLTYRSDFNHLPIARIGFAADAHQFTQGKDFKLGGATIPHHQTIAAFSDGDVVLHALSDAIFGALAMGDLGAHFPQKAEWKKASSDIFLAHALEKAKLADLTLINSDITVICQSPKIAPHRDIIRQSLADRLKLHIGQVSLKATTTDKMGMIGKNQGIAVMAAVSFALTPALVSLPPLTNRAE